jgi:hypothetical protein
VVRGKREGDIMEVKKTSDENLEDAFTAVTDPDVKMACPAPY